ncbi:MAG: exported protein of unknown function [Nitrospira sp.]|jgi:hypothetical protein|nr:exported protein of unknown function [Nitrospira sp.]
MRIENTKSERCWFSYVVAVTVGSLASLLFLAPSPAVAGRTLAVPVSETTYAETETGFSTFLMKWDEGGQPDPLALRWGRSQVPVRGTARGSIQRAFRYALKRLAPSIHPTGTLSLYATFTGPLKEEGSTAEAALAIGFLALIKGDSLIQHITITGTLESDGRIGQVAHVAEKTSVAARAGYRVLLVPRGQFYAPRVNLITLAPESTVLVREVDTIEEAYEIMTGKKL